VCEEYFFKHFPNGIALSAALRAAGGPAQYAVTTHPWLVHEFYDAAADCARTSRNASMLQMMDDAIARGDVRWHGKPMCVFKKPPRARALTSAMSYPSLARGPTHPLLAILVLRPALAPAR
jgi:hypothetical protein